MPQVTEPFFFASDLNRSVRGEPMGVANLEDYLALFRHARAGQVVGEKSVWYLYSQVAARAIDRFCPQAKFIILLRDPLGLFLSLHAQWLYDMMEDEPDAEKAWHLQRARGEGGQLPATCQQPALLQYGRICRLGEQLERLLAIIGPERVHCVLFDDLVASPRSTYLGILRFIGVEDDGRRDFPKVNPATAIRWKALASSLEILKTRLHQSRMERLLRPIITGLAPVKDGLRKLNTVECAKDRPSSELNRLVKQALASDVQRLGATLGRDLSHWTRID